MSLSPKYFENEPKSWANFPRDWYLIQRRQGKHVLVTQDYLILIIISYHKWYYTIVWTLLVYFKLAIQEPGILPSSVSVQLSKPQLNHNSTQPNITLGWVKHENNIAYTPPTTRPGKISSPTCILVFPLKTYCKTREFFHWKGTFNTKNRL